MFLNTHFNIARQDFRALQNNHNPNVAIIERDPPKLAEFLTLLKAVGGSYGWDRRPKYLDYPTLSARLSDKTTRFFDITNKGNNVGYSLITKPDNQADNVIEIENFGLFDKATDKGIGKTALPLVLTELFKTHNNIYLTTRSTNHDKVVPFYLDCGMNITKQEWLTDDLAPLYPAIKRA